MLRMNPSALRKALEQLEQAMDDQAEWHENLLRSIFCGLLCDPDDLAGFAHRLCRFGRWYYEKAPAELRRLPVFAAIGAEHEHLHQVAARLLRQVGSRVSIGRADFEDLVAAGARLRQEVDSLRHAIEAALRNRDVLTGAFGRIEMLPALRDLRALVKQHGGPCCLVFMDIDRLKHVNDTYGHQAGDAVLAGAVRCASEHLRPDDKVFRYGGDEFLIALPWADLTAGQAVISRVREGLARSLLVTGPGGRPLHVTASFGLALLDPAAGVADSIDRADQALLLAKAAGRNRTMCWDESVTTSTRWRQLRIDDIAL